MGASSPFCRTRIAGSLLLSVPTSRDCTPRTLSRNLPKRCSAQPKVGLGRTETGPPSCGCRHTGSLEYEVDTIRADSHPSQLVDAGTGAVLASRDKTAFAEGTGVKGDTKTFTTTPGGTGFLLESPDGRRATYDAGNKFVLPGTLMTDADDHWDLTLGRSFHSPDQRPGVDAFYYSGVADAFYRDTFGRDSFDDAGMKIVSTVHYGRHDCNAYWNGAQIVFPDMDYQPRVCTPNSGALDLVAHEFTHGVTQYTSGLTNSGRPDGPRRDRRAQRVLQRHDGGNGRVLCRPSWPRSDGHA